MTTQHLIDLSKVPVPDVIQLPSFEQKLSELKALLLSLDPAYTEALKLESEPMLKLLQVAAYRELHLIGIINDATRANILASSQGNDLAGLASRYNIERLVIQPADHTQTPPVPALQESDAALRRRVQMAFDGLNTAGSIDSYIYHALGADGRVRDADAYSPAPTEIILTILSHEQSGEASQQLIEVVRELFGLSADGKKQAAPSKVRPQGDRVTVQSASIIRYSVSAQVIVQRGPTRGAVLQEAQDAIEKYVSDQHKLGADVTLSGIHRALHQPGVKNVLISQPAQDIYITRTQAPYCTEIKLDLVTADDH